MLMLALKSRSKDLPQAGQSKVRMLSGISFFAPQLEQVLVLGNHWSTTIKLALRPFMSEDSLTLRFTATMLPK